MCKTLHFINLFDDLWGLFTLLSVYSFMHIHEDPGLEVKALTCNLLNPQLTSTVIQSSHWCLRGGHQ